MADLGGVHPNHNLGKNLIGTHVIRHTTRAISNAANTHPGLLNHLGARHLRDMETADSNAEWRHSRGEYGLASDELRRGNTALTTLRSFSDNYLGGNHALSKNLRSLERHRNQVAQSYRKNMGVNVVGYGRGPQFPEEDKNQ